MIQKGVIGFTLIELMVVSLLGLLIVGIALSSAILNKRVMGLDLARTKLSQSLRGALDIIGTDIRITGENLSNLFPAVELIDGANNTSDILILRRALIPEILPVCSDVNIESSIIYVSEPGFVAGCNFTNNNSAFMSWREYRQSQESGTVKAFIYDHAARVGEFFDYVDDDLNGSQHWLNISGGFSRDYPQNSSALYLIEEHAYRLIGDGLEQVVNGAVAMPNKVAFQVVNFQVYFKTKRGDLFYAFTSNHSWGDLSEIFVEILGAENFAGRQVSKSVSGVFFPRNILSLN
ncbi:MAG TPA: hypothetical protein PKD37_00825 [Oligoflexia bacterium]|nr:hypothetical protein [Oligoflexia bacterium]HMP26523.1 hypothetical protein [Oligoflexia bacterium]